MLLKILHRELNKRSETENVKKQGSWAFNKIPGEKEGNIEEMGIKVKVQKPPDLKKKKKHIKNTSSWRKKIRPIQKYNQKGSNVPFSLTEL